MFRPESLFGVAAAFVTGFTLVTFVFLSADFALANSNQPEAAAPCTCPESDRKSAKPKFAGLGSELDESDERAALESLQVALSKVSDGSSYVWHRANGRLSGLIQPTSSFRNESGAICRHIMVLLTTGERTKKREGIACRMENGLWRLDG
jgi:hypothetical protein